MLVSDVLIAVLYMMVSMTYVHKIVTVVINSNSPKDLSENPRYGVFVGIYFAISLIYFYKGLSE